ncbi:hypothetical protein ACLB1R_35095 [Escherichia coli]
MASCCLCTAIRGLENHPNKQAIVYGFLKEAGFSWQKGQFKAWLQRIDGSARRPMGLL